MLKVAYTNNSIYSIIQRRLFERIYDWNVFLFSQGKKKKEEILNRSRNESYDFADTEDLVTDRADGEISSTKYNDYEDPFDDLMSS